MADAICSIEDCNTEVAARGWCSKHWQRWKRHGDPHIVLPPSAGPQQPALERFWEKVDKTTTPGGCWTWKTAVDRDGYGHFKFGGRMWRAPRWIFNQTNDLPLAADEEVRHTCDNPPCFEPEHLFAGTMLDNTRDMIAKGRRRPDVGYIAGETHHQAKVTEAAVREIRSRRSAGAKYSELMADFGLSKTAIAEICTRKTWQHLT